ncbi:MAG: glycerophosphoryl diester phosphodiesterase [Actinomycetaceae bacterium]|nr:glycerophosphoryl diester phosphodiesterase [Arcanobacterium sp.]MDD7505693.1 glycerophosphoryl diester phosphodiesterase [Actinomycetaceae bacterium]MDY6143703.1 glycerophosphoryl diester phosphodiesterase [Arcanobacterium sp.]
MLTRTVIAHRGLNRLAPENTMAAFRLCAERSVKWLETDVDVIGDGTPILIHDSALDRTTDASGSYYDLSIDEVSRIDAGGWFSPAFVGERIPTLRQFVRFLNETGTNANIEIKQNEAGKAMTYRLVDNVIAELEHLDHGREVIISSFSQLILQLFRDRAPKLPRACLYEAPALYDDWRSVLEILDATYIHPEDSGLTPRRIEAFRRAGYGVNIWTVNSASRANELFNWGATGVFTDTADALAHLGRTL